MKAGDTAEPQRGPEDEMIDAPTLRLTPTDVLPHHIHSMSKARLCAIEAGTRLQEGNLLPDNAWLRSLEDKCHSTPL